MVNVWLRRRLRQRQVAQDIVSSKSKCLLMADAVEKRFLVPEQRKIVSKAGAYRED
jgi:hypothetical protein